MDRHLKERLVGAVVLVAAAIILIPAMLPDPREETPSVSGGQAAEGGMKTYTIDLTAPKERAPEPAPQAEIVPAPRPDDGPPPAEAVVAETTGNVAVQPAPQLPAPPQAVTAERKPAERVADQPAPARVAQAQPQKPEEKPAEKQVDKPVQKPEEKPATAQPATAGWAVQVASFGVRATSERIADDLKAKGFSAYVTSFVVKEQTMYRVRVGPARDREAAEALLQKVKLLHPNAAVVTQ